MRCIFFIILILTSVACNGQTSEDLRTANKLTHWDRLLDKDLTQWDNYLSYKFKPGYDGSKPDTDPIGFNQPEGDDVFSTITRDDETILRVSGETYGSIITKSSYRNYHLKLKVKWGDIKWNPRKDLLKDSGILYHSVGPHGAEFWRSWMQAQELQIMEGHMGDYWSQATSAMDVRAYTPEYIMNPIASTTQPFLSVGHNEDIKGLVIRSDNHESDVGDWTSIELICFEGQSLHIVNGHIVMVLKTPAMKKTVKSSRSQKVKSSFSQKPQKSFTKILKFEILRAYRLNIWRYFKAHNHLINLFELRLSFYPFSV